MTDKAERSTRAWEDSNGLVTLLFDQIGTTRPPFTNALTPGSTEALHRHGREWRTRLVLSHSRPRLLLFVMQQGPNWVRFVRFILVRDDEGVLHTQIDGKPLGATIKALRRHRVSVAGIQHGFEVEGALPDEILSFLKEVFTA